MLLSNTNTSDLREAPPGSLDTVILPKGVKSAERALELIIVPTVLLVIIGSYHLHFMLMGGDWDFWLDWKDREWWLTITPISMITYIGALHYILWTRYRLPFGGTLAITALLIGEWAVRFGGFHLWSHYPINFVTPATALAGAIAIDTVLALSGSFIITGFFGGALFGLLFYPQNAAWLSAYYVPIEKNGIVMTVADLIGFEYIRTGTPEYIRMIERGTLRTFGQHSAPVSAFFSAFVCAFMYWIWWAAGSLFSSTKYTKAPM